LLSFSGSPGQIYLIQASGDLQHWDTIGIANEADAGLSSSMTPRADAAARYYRLVAP